MQDGIGFAYQGHKIVIGLAPEDDAVIGMTSSLTCAAAYLCPVACDAYEQCMLCMRRP